MKVSQSMYESLVIASLQEVRVKTHLASAVQRGDEAAVRYGPMTHQVSICAGMPLARARYYLNRLKSAGHIIGNATFGGTTRWWPVGFAEDLKAHQVVDDGVTYFISPPVRVIA